MKTGIILTTPGGHQFWHPCVDAAAGYREMESIKFTYGAAWEHSAARVEFGTDDGEKFTASERLWPRGA